MKSSPLHLPFIAFCILLLLFTHRQYRTEHAVHTISQAVAALTNSQTISLTDVPAIELDEFVKKMRVNYTTVMMHPQELNLILRYLQNATTYLEWGSGGSTLTFPQFVQSAISIEHNPQWCKWVRGELMRRKMGNVRYECVPVEWKSRGTGDDGGYKEFARYVEKVGEVGHEVDVVLVDGRARVSCAIRALEILARRGVLVLHDWEERGKRGYEGVLEFYEIVESVGGKRPGVVVMERRREWEFLRGNRSGVREVMERRFG